MQYKDDKSKNKKAVAISYKEGYFAPKVVAKGKGLVAEKILERAREEDVAIYEDKELVEELSKIELGLDIPPQLYEVIAQVLLFVSDIDKLEKMKEYGK